MNNVKKKTRKQLKAEIKALKSQSLSSYYFASKALEILKNKDMTSSGVIVSIDYINGKQAIEPVMINLSSLTLENLLMDIQNESDNKKDFIL